MKKLFKKSIVILFTVLILMTALLTLSACGECDHDYGDFYVYHEPTMTSVGHVKADCKHCDQYLYRDLPSFSENSEYAVYTIVEPTCTTKGSSRFIIAKNTYGLKDYEFIVETDEIPHDYQNCISTNEHVHYGTCSVCDAVGNENHSIQESVITPATCKAEGLMSLYCTDCDYEEEVAISTYSHSCTSWKVTNEPTCYVDGLKERTCVGCSTKFTEVIPKLTHKYVNLSYKEPTCKAQGNTSGTHCEHCGLFGNGAYTLATVDHSYVGGECKWCETQQPITVTYVYADQTDEDKDMLYGDKFEYIDQDNSRYNVFLGWYDINDVKYTSDTVLTSSVTVYAKWESSIKISTKEEFMQIYSAPTKSYYLDADINMNGEVLSPITGFTGTIDGYKSYGENYVIANFGLSVTGTVTNYGLFATNGGTIKNITFKDFTLNGNITCGSGGAIGSIVGTNNGTIENVDADNIKFVLSTYASNTSSFSIGIYAGKNNGNMKDIDVKGEINVEISARNIKGTYVYYKKDYQYYRIGGVCGINTGEIERTYAVTKGNIGTRVRGAGGNEFYVYSYCGGFVGSNESDGKISNSYAQTEINLEKISRESDANEYTNIGGFAGINSGTASITECFSRGKVSGRITHGNNIGGFVGCNDSATASIRSCYTFADVSVTKSIEGGNIGGFVGLNSATIQNSYTAGSVRSLVGYVLGGFVGNNASGGSISKSYTTSDVTATSGTAGIYAGINSGNISASYQTDDIIFKSGSSTLGSMSLTTEITEISFNELISEVFLVENLYWDGQGWYIGSDNHPFLNWEFDKLHDYVEYEPVAPTCTTAGFTVFECRVCGTIFIKDVIAPLGHNLVEEKDKHLWVEPTHTTEGREEYVCMHEGYDMLAHTHVVVLPALGHIDESANISCTELILKDGTYYYKCEECSTQDNEVLVEIDISRVTHVERNVGYIAPSCGEYDTKTQQWLTAPTEGRTAGRDCSHCGYVIRGCNTISPHTFDEGTVVSEATCEVEGKKEVTCSGCHYVEEITIDKLPHNYTDGSLVCSECDKPRYVIDQSFTAISSVSDLKDMIQGANYYLACDIDLNNVPFTPLFSEDDPFIGVFLGQGYKIKNLVLNAENVTTGYTGGIFSAVGARGKVLGLTIENATVNVDNVNIAQIGLVAGVNNGEISVCTISGNITLNLTSVVTSKTTGVIASSFDYTFGSITAVNGKTGEINGCTVNGNILSTYNVSTNLSATNVSNYFSQLVNNTKITNDTTITFGGLCGTNRGLIKNSSMLNGIVNTMTVESKVGGVNRGRTFTNLTLNEGNFCGINTAMIVNCTSTAKGSTIHEVTENGLVSNNLISVLGVALKQEYYKIVDNTVYESLVGVIGNSSKSAVADVATVA